MSKIAKHPTPVARLVTVTPEMSSRFLLRSKRKNVPVSNRNIDRYGADMVAGKWDPNNSQMCSIDYNEDIVNGHQRFMASEKFKVSFDTWLITGVPPETFATEDSGRVRNSGHYFALLGEEYYIELGLGARALLLWERGLWHQTHATGGFSSITRNEDLKAELEARPMLREAARFYSVAKKLMKGRRFPGGTVIALWCLTYGHPKHGAFWTELFDRVGGNKLSPCYQLNLRVDKVLSKQTRLSPKTMNALLTKAWNLYSTDDTRELVFSGGKNEAMPQPLTDLKPMFLPPESKAAEYKMPQRTIRYHKAKQTATAKPSANGQHRCPKQKKVRRLDGGLKRAAA